MENKILPIRRPSWEERSAARVVEKAGDRLLRRSRRLVQAATELAHAKSLDEITLNMVLERAGLSLKAFYGHFTGKDDLMLAVFEDAMRSSAAQWRALIEAITDPLERLALLVRTMFHAEGQAQFRMNMVRENLRLAELRPVDHREAIEPLIAVFREEVEAGMNAGVIRSADARTLAFLLLQLPSASIHAQVLSGDGGQDPRRLANEVWDFCLRAIRA